MLKKKQRHLLFVQIQIEPVFTRIMQSDVNCGFCLSGTTEEVLLLCFRCVIQSMQLMHKKPLFVSY